MDLGSTEPLVLVSVIRTNIARPNWINLILKISYKYVVTSGNTKKKIIFPLWGVGLSNLDRRFKDQNFYYMFERISKEFFTMRYLLSSS